MAIHISPSKRLTYRLLHANEIDAELLFELDQDPKVMHFINGGEPTSREDISAVFIPRLGSYTNPAFGWGMWGVFEKPNETFIGWVLVRPMHFFSDNPQYRNLELGWRFKQLAWGRGIATEAAQQVLEGLANAGVADYFSAIAVRENAASLAIMKKLGMQFIESGIHRDPLGDMLVDTYQMNNPRG